jgi:aspartate kinase
MKVFKFGGASVKDAAGVRNVSRVLERFAGDDLVIVVSAMGKTTNALEDVVWRYTEGRDARAGVDALRAAHAAVLAEVAPRDEAAAARLGQEFDDLEAFLLRAPFGLVDRQYDQIVSLGEIWSTVVVSAYLSAAGFPNTWADARRIIRTDDRYRSARVDWAASLPFAAEAWQSVEGRPKRLLTQGFIGRGPGGTTTLGREGSDFSAAILAYLLDAESVTIWKDVPGMFNADPRRFADTTRLAHISYREAIELSYFGASVIHPRTK